MSGYEVDESLIKLANEWPVYWDAVTRPIRNTTSGEVVGGDTVKITRCSDCEEEIFFGGSHMTGTLRHLMSSHGYRMDGRQFDNQNREVGHA